MSTRRFIGASATQAQVVTAVVGGTIEVGDLFIVTINTKRLVVAATSTVAASVAEQIANEFNALDSVAFPEFKEMVAQANAANVTFEAVTAGVPFTMTTSTTEANGDASDSQTFASSTTTANLSPNSAGIAANWSGNALPVDGDTVVFDVESPSCLWDLSALSAVSLASLQIVAEATQIGLTDRNAAGYPEYRPLFFAISATSVLVQTGSGLVNLDLGAVDTSVLVKRTGSSGQQHRRALCLKGGTASSPVTVLRGSVGIAMLAGEAATFGDVRTGFVDNLEGDADVYCGPDATLATVSKGGGKLETWSNVTTGTNRAGTWIIQAGAVTTLNTSGTGVSIYNSTGTLATAKLVEQGTLDFSRDERNKTITNPVEIFGPNARFLDPSNLVNVGGSLIFDLNENSGIANITLGANRRITVGSVA